MGKPLPELTPMPLPKTFMPTPTPPGATYGTPKPNFKDGGHLTKKRKTGDDDEVSDEAVPSAPKKSAPDVEDGTAGDSQADGSADGVEASEGYVVPVKTWDDNVEPIGIEYVKRLKSEDGNTRFFCKICTCTVGDPASREQHIRGKKHKMAYKKKVDPTYVVGDSGAAISPPPPPPNFSRGPRGFRPPGPHPNAYGDFGPSPGWGPRYGPPQRYPSYGFHPYFEPHPPPYPFYGPLFGPPFPQRFGPPFPHRYGPPRPDPYFYPPSDPYYHPYYPPMYRMPPRHGMRPPMRPTMQPPIRPQQRPPTKEGPSTSRTEASLAFPSEQPTFEQENVQQDSGMDDVPPGRHGRGPGYYHHPCEPPEQYGPQGHYGPPPPGPPHFAPHFHPMEREDQEVPERSSRSWSI